MLNNLKVLVKISTILNEKRIESGATLIEENEIEFEYYNVNNTNTFPTTNRSSELKTSNEEKSIIIQNNTGPINSTEPSNKELTLFNEAITEELNENLNINLEIYNQKIIIPNDYQIKEKTRCEIIIDELMIVVNKLTAEILHKSFLKEYILLRKHSLLNDNKFLETQRYLSYNKLNVDFSNPIALNEMLLKLKANDENKFIVSINNNNT